MKTNFLKTLSIVTLLMPNLVFAASLGTTTANFDVTANIIPVCTIAVEALNFGDYEGLTNTDAQTTMSVTCDADSTPTFKLDGGKNALNSSRRLQDAGKLNYINYTMYSDSGRTAEIPIDTIDSNITIAHDGTSHSYTLYGRIPSGQLSQTGAYSDSLIVTIGF